MSAALVIGAGGLLGSEVVAHLLASGREVARRTHEELDALSGLRCRRELRRVQPDVVVDCTAVRARSGEKGPRIAEAASNIAVAARAVGAFTIYLSCADVFDGYAEEPYIESDRPQPPTDFGVAKLEAEQAVAAANERHALVRTSWLFGPGGPNIVEATLSAADISDTVPVEATTRSCPTYTAHLAEALVGLVQQPAYGVFHVAGAGSATKLQLARTVLRMARSPARAVALTDSESSLDVRNLVLESRRDEISRLPEWQIGVGLYLEAQTRASFRRRAHLSADEVDLASGAALLSLAEADRLSPAPGETKPPDPTSGDEQSGAEGEGTPGDSTPDADSERASAAQRRVWLTINATEDDLHTLQRALTGLRDVVKPGPMRIELTVKAEHLDASIDRIQFQNRVRQHLEEDEDVTFTEQWE